jgi:D-alanyl-D-alanine carboxypeptidase/D-alanyl-D-alanine-endopeptidase (penicillin-binding protein 4)
MRSLFPALLLATTLLVPLARGEDHPDKGAEQGGQAPCGGVAEALATIDKSWLFARTNAGLAVVDLTSGQEVYSRNGDRLLNPASTMKVVTAAAALRNLGPSYRFTTDIFYDGELEPGGTLKGNLYIKGHGDPTFVSEKLWKMVGEIELMGVERVEGSVIFDDSFHRGSTMIPGWDKPEDLEKGTSYFASLSALSLNANTVVMVVRPGAEVGSTARVDLELPVDGYVQFDNQVRTGPPGTRKFVEVKREALPDATKFTLEGSVPVDDLDRTWIRRTVADPTAHFMAAIRQQFDDQDIDVEGKFIRGTTPVEAELLLSMDSPPLSQILADMNKSSLNFVAEQVLRTVGAEIAGEGSTEAGIGVVSQYLTSIGVAPQDVVLVNGSGLSREAKLKPNALTRVLLDMARDPRVGSEFSASLAISGTDGTLWSRLREDPGRLRGKTGTLDEVHCLTGYIDSQGGKRYAFAFLVNNYGTRLQAVRDVHDAFARQMFVLGEGLE